MPLCTLMMRFDMNESGSNETDPNPGILSWTVYINGLSPKHRKDMMRIHHLEEKMGGCLTVTHNDTTDDDCIPHLGTDVGHGQVNLDLSSVYIILTKYLNFLDSIGYKVVGCVGESTNHEDTKYTIRHLKYTLQM